MNMDVSDIEYDLNVDDTIADLRCPQNGQR